MGHSRWRFAAAGALALGFAAAGSAALAAPPTEQIQQGTNISCWYAAEAADFSVDGVFDTEGHLIEGYGNVVTDGVYGYGLVDAGTLGEDSFSLSFDFLSEGDEFLGHVTVEGDYFPMGEPWDVDERYRDGNVQVKVAGTIQELLVTGDVTEATDQLEWLTEVDLACSGANLDLTSWNTNPASFIYRGAYAGTWCEIDEDTALILDVYEDIAYTVFGDGIDWETGMADLIAQGELPVVGTSIAGALEVIEPPPVEEPDLVMVDLTIGDVLDSGTDKYMSPESAYRYDYTIYALTGTLLLPDESEVTVDCTYETYDYWERYSTRAGQKPGGRAPVNDLPEDALELLDVASTSTRGADELPEAPCVVTYGEDSFEIPFGRTVWYSIEGTGEEVVLSTAGSDFDTVLGVYEPGTLDQVACVDDTFESLQAEITLPTVEGDQYLVQVGGFAADWGLMQLTRQ